MVPNLLPYIRMVGMTQINSHPLFAGATGFRFEDDFDFGLRYLPFRTLQWVGVAKPLLAGRVDVCVFGRIDFDRNAPTTTYRCEPQQKYFDCLDAIGDICIEFRSIL